MAASTAKSKPSPERIFNTMVAFQETEALKAAIELDIFTAIAEGANTAESLAGKTGTSERGMRILHGERIPDKNKQPVFAHRGRRNFFEPPFAGLPRLDDQLPGQSMEPKEFRSAGRGGAQRRDGRRDRRPYQGA